MTVHHDDSVRRFRTRALALLALGGTLFATACSEGPTGPQPAEGPVVDGVRLRILSESVEHPVAMARPTDDGRILVAERRGRILVLSHGQIRGTAFLDLRGQVAQSNFEQGLLGLALHPQFESNGFFYVNYTDLDGNTRVVRYSVSSDPDRADPASGSLILEVAQPGPRHNGGNLVFGPDGMLYIGMGDGTTPAQAQNPESLLGAMLRIDVDGADPYAIPSDNPYVGVAGRDEIWAKGLRNPWRWSFDHPTDRLIIADVGESLWEEINVVPAGAPGLNYGWPDVEGLECRAGDGCPEPTVEPVLTYDHEEGCAVVGGYVYRGSALPQLQGHYFYGDNCRNWLRSFDPADPDDVKTWDFGDDIGTVFSFGVDSDDELYVLTIDGIYRLEQAE